METFIKAIDGVESWQATDLYKCKKYLYATQSPATKYFSNSVDETQWIDDTFISQNQGSEVSFKKTTKITVAVKIIQKFKVLNDFFEIQAIQDLIQSLRVCYTWESTTSYFFFHYLL